MTDTTFAGRAVLIAEDEYLLAFDLKLSLTRSGATVVGPAPSVERAMELIESGCPIDAALLDVNLGGEEIFPVADVLLARGVPIVFTTGYDPSIIPTRFADVPRFEKPFTFRVIGESLQKILEISAKAR